MSKIEDQIFPSKCKMASSFIWAVVRFMFSTCPTTTREERQIRVNICKKCLCEVHGRCVLCGCFISLKTWCKFEKCKLEWW